MVIGGKEERQPQRSQSGTETREGVNGDGIESYKPRRAPRTQRKIEKIKLAGFEVLVLGVWVKEKNKGFASASDLPGLLDFWNFYNTKKIYDIGDFGMFLLLMVSLAGLVLSAVLHLLIVFQIYNPPREFSILINLGAAFTIYAAIAISRRTGDQTNHKEFRKNLYGLCPPWLATGTGFLVMYALAGLLYVAVKKHFGDSASANTGGGGKNYYGLSCFWMALYAIAFCIAYSCRKYVEDFKKKQNNMDL